jgi:protein-disulfide isomerase
MVQKAQTDHQINSTPTFIVNGKEKVEGAKGIEDFQKAVDAAE